MAGKNEFFLRTREEEKYNIGNPWKRFLLSKLVNVPNISLLLSQIFTGIPCLHIVEKLKTFDMQLNVCCFLKSGL